MKEENKENDDLFDFLGSLSKAIKETEEKYIFEHNFNFPIEITGIKKAYGFISEDLHCKTGSLVKVRPCGGRVPRENLYWYFLG